MLQHCSADCREFYRDVVHGLSQSPKRLSCKYFYDERGSQLFEQICELEEYYLTRTELAIIEAYADEMAYQLGEGVMLVEFGSGNSLKTRILLERLQNPAAYVPVDISADHLLTSTADLRVEYPNLEILPVVADFTKQFCIPKPRCSPSHAAVFFPGSTIGNFEPVAARQILFHIARMVGKQGGLLIGIDLQKDKQTIEAAYNDADGITAKFNLNILNHINLVLGADFDLNQFEHRSVYEQAAERVETFVVSRRKQTVALGSHQFSFQQDELVHTEYSYKYTIEGFCRFASEAGLIMHHYWTDPEQMFAVIHLVNELG